MQTQWNIGKIFGHSTFHTRTIVIWFIRNKMRENRPAELSAF
ncbi:hypothetical protein SALWKB2_1834 [Snodgrassella alvi wkB2]|nr:hypothetical protein SALWKB2_1834 [Snodgrassella alvi wkB2]